MPLDAYSPCPGGLDKKIKFCCPDLISELEKLRRMMEGEQNKAALEYLDKIEAKFPNRPCLMATRIALLDEEERDDEARPVIDRFLQQHPANPIALAEAALFTLQEQGIEAGIAQLQSAVEHVGEVFPRQLYEALGATAVAALAAGRPIAAIAHLAMQHALSPDEKSPLQLIGRVMLSPSVPVLLKDQRRLVGASESFAWKPQFEKALAAAAEGRWRAAAEQFETLANRSPDPVPAWQNAAKIRSWLGNNAAAVAALRKIAGANVPYDDAVEAEALALLLDPEQDQQTIELVSVVYPLEDIDRLNELLISSDRASRVNLDSRARNEEEPPPRSVFALLDRPVPATGVDIAVDAIPRVLGTVYLHGKQTDRAARVELLGHRDAQLEEARQLLALIAGGTIGPPGEETVLDRTPALRHAMTANWRLPDDTPADRVRALSDEFRRDNILQRWTRMPLALLDQKTPLEAKEDPAYRIKLGALVLLFELTAEQEGGQRRELQELREMLALPEAGPIDPSGMDLEQLPLARFARLELAKLTDDQLLYVYRRALSTALRGVSRRAALEILARDQIDAKIDLGDVYATLAYTSIDSSEGLQYIEQGRDWSVKKGRSSASWDLEELNLRLARAEPEEATRVINHLVREHINEPGVRQTLTELLYAVGAIGPDGRPVRASEEGQPIAAGAAAEPSAIWTPESQAPGEQKSKLWVPGMD